MPTKANYRNVIPRLRDDMRRLRVLANTQELQDCINGVISSLDTLEQLLDAQRAATQSKPMLDAMENKQRADQIILEGRAARRNNIHPSLNPYAHTKDKLAIAVWKTGWALEHFSYLPKGQAIDASWIDPIIRGEEPFPDDDATALPPE